MIITSLELQNYRNYEHLYIEFDSNINILYGNNAQGKTNILEAIYLSATTKSHRGSKDKEIIRFNQEESHIKLYFIKNNIKHKVDLHLKQKKSKGIAIDGIPVKRIYDLLGVLNIIFFAPEDLSLIKRGPNERRNFINTELCQLDKIYLNNLTNYGKIINQRNILLKQLAYSPSLIDTLEIWDFNLVKYGNQIIYKRVEFIENLNKIIKNIHKELTGNKENIELIYEPSIIPEIFFDELKKRRDKDLKNFSTQIGPHRDDICFKINGIDVRKYGSQGQQRTAALSLKLAEIELVKKLTNNTPILLLDDVLSELDSDRKEYLLNNINNIQTILTTTGLDNFVNKRVNINKIFEVENGKIIFNN